jgi:hypothetical protein
MDPGAGYCILLSRQFVPLAKAAEYRGGRGDPGTKRHPRPENQTPDHTQLRLVKAPQDPGAGYRIIPSRQFVPLAKAAEYRGGRGSGNPTVHQT